MAADLEMLTYAARLASFITPPPPSKRRASTANKKRAAAPAAWPHASHAPEDLARAGFAFRPGPGSRDNVQCFCCAVKLDGWEPADVPLREHLAHAPACAYALAYSTSRVDRAVAPDESRDEGRDPFCAELRGARTATYGVGAGWPHEGKRGWRPTVGRLVEAGWTFDPSPEGDDGTTCFWCNLSLDGWEPRDDPLQEHRRRSPECPFFALCERYGVGFAAPAIAKGKGKGGGRGSKASRPSTQSQMSTFSDAPSYADLGEGEVSASAAAVDDSVMTTASTATAKGGRKKAAGRAKAAAKGAKGRKKVPSEEAPMSIDEQIPYSLRAETEEHSYANANETLPDVAAEDVAPAPKAKGRPGRKPRGSKQTDSSVLPPDSSVVEITAPKKPATRGRKAKAQPEPQSHPQLDAESVTRESDVSAQLLNELEDSIEMPALPQPDEDSTPKDTRPKRGVKRTSDGVRKVDESVVGAEMPVALVAKGGKKGKKGGKKDKADVEEERYSLPASQNNVAPVSKVDEWPVDEDVPQLWLDRELVANAAKAKKAPAKKGGKQIGGKVSRGAMRPSESTLDGFRDHVEDVARDEREIEDELSRYIATAEAAATISPSPSPTHNVPTRAQHNHNADDGEPSPTPKQAARIHKLEAHMAQEAADLGAPGKNLAAYVAAVAAASPQSGKATDGPSPTPSDKENAPPPSRHRQSAAPVASPTKRSQVLAGTPNRSARNPLSPSRPLGALLSGTPWQPVDLDTALLASPQLSPGTLGAKLIAAAGLLGSAEERMSVEQWVRWRAGEGESELRRRCEARVGVFEREGLRALGGVQGWCAS